MLDRRRRRKRRRDVKKVLSSSLLSDSPSSSSSSSRSGGRRRPSVQEEDHGWRREGPPKTEKKNPPLSLFSRLPLFFLSSLPSSVSFVGGWARKEERGIRDPGNKRAKVGKGRRRRRRRRRRVEIPLSSSLHGAAPFVGLTRRGRKEGIFLLLLFGWLWETEGGNLPDAS